MEPLTHAQISARVESAIAKVDQRGRRGMERVTHDEIEALVLAVVMMKADAAELHAELQKLLDDVKTKSEESTDV